jgi:fructokinase
MTDSSTNYTIVGLGELLWDLLPSGKQLGGAPANFAYHAQALGANSAVVSAVGDDDLGHELRDRLAERGLNLDCLATDPSHPTGTVTVEVDGEGKPQYTIHEDVAWDFIPWTKEMNQLAERCHAVCFGSLAQRSPTSAATVKTFIDATRPDCLRVFDINLRQHYYNADIIRHSLNLATILKINDEELPVVGELLSLGHEERKILDALVNEYDLDAIALTRGGAGSLIHTRSEQVGHGGFPPERIADTVGAGDSFTAAMVMGLLMDHDLGAICAHANRLASFVCTQEGAMPRLPEALKAAVLAGE